MKSAISKWREFVNSLWESTHNLESNPQTIGADLIGQKHKSYLNLIESRKPSRSKIEQEKLQQENQSLKFR